MNNGEVLYDLGVDLNSNFTFHDGDFVLAKYDDNLVQAICNRLNTRLDELQLFYLDYGSIFRDFLGWHNNDETIGFMSGELETVLLAEARVSDWEFDIKVVDGVVRIDLVLKPDEDYSISATLVLTSDGVELVEE